MPIPFYNQADQDIYASGEHFIPQERFRQNYTPSTALASTIGNTGITNTQAASPYKWPPQGGGGGGGGVSSNKFGLNMDTLKTIDQGKWQEAGGPANMYPGMNIKTSRDIAQAEGGIWKDVNTGQNVYHGGFNVEAPLATLLNKFTGKPTIGDPNKGTWTGSEWEEDFDPTVATKKLNMIQRWKAKKEFKAAQEQAVQDARERAATQHTYAGGDPSLNQGEGGAYSGRGDKGATSANFSGDFATDAESYDLAKGGRIGYQGGELVEDEYMAEATPGGMMEENIEEVQGEPSREQLEAIALEIFQLPLEELNEEQLEVVYQAAMEQEPSEEEVQFAAQEGPGEGIASLV